MAKEPHRVDQKTSPTTDVNKQTNGIIEDKQPNNINVGNKDTVRSTRVQTTNEKADTL